MQRQLIIDFAKYQIGYTEGRNNSNQYSQFFNANNRPWCGDFVSWCARQAGIPENVIPSSAYVPDFVTFYTSRSRFKRRGTYTPQMGDLIVFDFNGNGSGDHIGLVESIQGSYVYTIEGNTSKAGENANGDGVWRKGRSLSYSGILGYCLPAYIEEEEVEIKEIKIKHSEKGIVTLNAVNVNGENYVRLRDTELIAPVEIGWDGKYPTVKVNYKV